MWHQNMAWHQGPKCRQVASESASGALDRCGVAGRGPPSTCHQNVLSGVGGYVHPHGRPPCRHVGSGGLFYVVLLKDHDAFKVPFPQLPLLVALRRTRTLWLELRLSSCCMLQSRGSTHFLLHAEHLAFEKMFHGAALIPNIALGAVNAPRQRAKNSGGASSKSLLSLSGPCRFWTSSGLLGLLRRACNRISRHE